MSIYDQIQRRLESGELRSITPLMNGTISRKLYLSRDLFSRIEGPWGDISVEKRFGRLRADLERFVTGGHIVACLVPYKAKTAYMGKLDADEVWDIRSQDPSPGLRVFGRFAARDIFIGLGWAPRSRDWAGKRLLGERDSQDWKDEISLCKREWHRLLHPYNALEGNELGDYLSGNCSTV